MHVAFHYIKVPLYFMLSLTVNGRADEIRGLRTSCVHNVMCICMPLYTRRVQLYTVQCVHCRPTMVCRLTLSDGVCWTVFAVFGVFNILV